MPERLASRRDVVHRLAGARKSNRGAPGYSRWINRPVGRQFAALAYLAGRTPNQVSLLSGVFTFAGIAVLAIFPPGWAIAVIVPALLLIGYGLDSADGQLARLRGGGSFAGEWLDHVLDALKASSFHLAIAVLWFRHFHLDHPTLLLVPLGFAVVDSTLFFAALITDLLRRVARAAAGQSAVTTASVDPNETAPMIRSLISLPNDYGVMCLSLVLIPVHDAFIAVYTVLAIANLALLVAGGIRWFREMSRLA